MTNNILVNNFFILIFAYKGGIDADNTQARRGMKPEIVTKNVSIYII